MANKTQRIIDPFFYWLILWGWFGYIVLSPIYLFKSGLPQPADILIFAVSLLAMGLYSIQQKIALNAVFTALCGMVVLFGAINICYGLYYGDVRFYYATLYYLFNAMVFATTVLVFKNDATKAQNIARLGIFCALGIELVWTFVLTSHSPNRETGSFNNPNQLGYWGVLTAASLLALNHGRRMPYMDILGILVGGYLVIASLSRAAIIGYAIILIALFIGRSIPATVKIGIVLSACLLTFVQIMLHPSAIEITQFDKLTERFSLHENTDPEKFTERGYERLWEYPQYLIYGAGEGAHWRFMDVLYAERSIGGGREIHSGLASVLFSYGIFGFALFAGFIYAIFRKAPPLLWFGLSAIMVYGLTHQNIRFTSFWIYIGIVYGMTRYGLAPQIRRNNDPT